MNGESLYEKPDEESLPKYQKDFELALEILHTTLRPIRRQHVKCLNLDPRFAETAARMMGDCLKACSVYKRRKMAEHMCKVPVDAKVLLHRQFLDFNTAGFSMEATLQPHRITNTLRFVKCDMLFPMAMGDNTNGRLGIGSEEPNIQELQYIRIKEPIMQVYFGPSHTIFKTESGEFYGAGKAANFLEGPVDERTIISSPVKLDYVKAKTIRCVLDEHSTKFLDFNTKGSTLVIGRLAAKFEETMHSSGNNWKIIDSEWGSNAKFKIYSVEVNTVKRFKTFVEVRNDSVWKCSYKYSTWLPIVFIVGGMRVDPERMWMRWQATADGTVYACHRRTFYKGTFQLAPQKETSLFGRDDSSDEEEAVNHEDANKVLMAVLEEVAFPIAIEKFELCRENFALVLIPTPPGSSIDQIQSLPKFSPHSPMLVTNFDDNIPVHFCHATILVEEFNKIFADLPHDWTDFVYLESGITGERTEFVQALLKLKYVLKPGREKGIPEILEKASR
ncbi:unnamed protein product [Caenorhabditis sp. 36 PRJEB53466]|nr:unnamed protein product [Caenorhabditis sp. 36 PRJEB53466]